MLDLKLAWTSRTPVSIEITDRRIQVETRLLT
jgi:hypothetical protein